MVRVLIPEVPHYLHPPNKTSYHSQPLFASFHSSKQVRIENIPRGSSFVQLSGERQHGGQIVLKFVKIFIASEKETRAPHKSEAGFILLRLWKLALHHKGP